MDTGLANLANKHILVQLTTWLAITVFLQSDATATPACYCVAIIQG